jgi:hypothetical protein
VLGAFLVGVLSTTVDARSMLAGMAVGLVLLGALWWTGAVAWTWYAFTGAAVTSLTAIAVARVRPRVS